MVVGKFCMGDLIGPGTQVRSAEDSEVHFNLLVDLFHFAVRLRVVCCGKGEVVVEKFSKLLSKDRGKLWATIGDHFVVEPKAEIYFVEEEGSNPLSGDCFLSGAENYPLRKAMVNHKQ